MEMVEGNCKLYEPTKRISHEVQSHAAWNIEIV